ncbi:MAG: DUF6671 family protein [Cyanobacteriota bacterium]
MFQGRCIALASRHGKDKVLARPLQAGLGLTLQLATAFDTDSLGTFSGERERPADAATTCRRKAEAAMAELDLDLGIASEGSFGPHPAVPLLAVGHEWLTLVDARQGLVVCEQLAHTATNFSQRRAASIADLDSWLRQVGFPHHGLIVRPSRPGHDRAPTPALTKGIVSTEALALAIEQALPHADDGLALVETDMRAHLNPTRMASLRRLAFRLVRRLRSTCPACGAPGWGLVATVAGLPCDWCGTPTELVAHERHGCVACDHVLQQPRRDGLRAADPGQCPRCNP